MLHIFKQNFLIWMTVWCCSCIEPNPMAQDCKDVIVTQDWDEPIIDANGTIWKIGFANKVVMNGKPMESASGAQALLLWKYQFYYQRGNSWYKYDGSSWMSVGSELTLKLDTFLNCPYRSSTVKAQSCEDMIVTGESYGAITDKYCIKWMITDDRKVNRNDAKTVHYPRSIVKLLFYFDGDIYYWSERDYWYKWDSNEWLDVSNLRRQIVDRLSTCGFDRSTGRFRTTGSNTTPCPTTTTTPTTTTGSNTATGSISTTSSTTSSTTRSTQAMPISVNSASSLTSTTTTTDVKATTTKTEPITTSHITIKSSTPKDKPVSPSFVPPTCNNTDMGKYCNTSGKPCDRLKPCQNSFNCTNDPSRRHGYFCTCKPGYSGTNCDENIQPCQLNTCLYKGDCVEVNNTKFHCNCTRGRTGIHCDLLIDNCKNVTCLNQGICRSLLNNYKCECLFGTSGDHCENVTTSLVIRQYVSKSFGYIVIIALVVTITFIIILDILKYGFGIDPVYEERERIRRQRSLHKGNNYDK